MDDARSTSLAMTAAASTGPCYRADVQHHGQQMLRRKWICQGGILGSPTTRDAPSVCPKPPCTAVANAPEILARSRISRVRPTLSELRSLKLTEVTMAP